MAHSLQDCYLNYFVIINANHDSCYQVIFSCYGYTGKKWNFLLKHSTGNLQEIFNEIYCSKTVVIPYLGNFTCQSHFLASMEFQI